MQSHQEKRLFEHLRHGTVKLAKAHRAHIHLRLSLHRDKKQGRNGADTEHGRKLLLLVYVHLIDVDLALILLGQGPHQVA